MLSKMTGDKVLVKVHEDEKKEKVTKSGIVLAGTVNSDRHKRASVLVTGPSCAVVKPGDTILFEQASGRPLQDEDENAYMFLREEAVIGVF